jgi:hypothetical protein
MEAQVASRLKRWGLATGIAVVGVLVATLPPGPPTLPLLFAPLWEEAEPTGIDGHLHSVRRALIGAEWDLRVAQVRTSLDRVRPNGEAPVVLHFSEGSATATPDTRFTSHLRKLWQVHQIPTGPVRTVLVTGVPESHPGPEAVLPRTPGVCFARLVNKFETRRRADQVGTSAGLCAIASRFGAPGESVRRWVEGVGHVVVPEVAPWVDPSIRPRAGGVQLAEWAVGGRQSWSEDRVPWWAGREVLACAKGRAEFCPVAVGLGGWTPGGARNTRFSRAYPSELPAAMLAELGPERFGELWRSDAPIPESFERLSGTAFDPWAMQFVQRRIGRVERPTALGLGGWLGWIFWMGLLTGWTFVRLRNARAR